MRGHLSFLAALGLVSAHGQSNIDPAFTVIPSELIGPLNWRPLPGAGAVVSQYYCSGQIYGPSVGWISLGSGAPANRVQYANNSATDYGVNVAASGDLSGFAYGANIGWINFVAAGHPRIDFTSGKLSGSVWAANAGWIPLTTANQFVRLESLPELPDADNDGLPDAWEIQVAGNLTELTGDADTDHDGQTDLEEYFSGTNPLDASDFLSVRLSVSLAGNQLQFPTKSGYNYRVEQHPAFGSGVWSPVSIPAIAGTGTTAVVPLPEVPSHLFFYRVASYPPLTEVQ